MTRLLRAIGIAIAVAAVVDPVIVRRPAVPLPIGVLMPARSDPDYPRAEALKEELASALDRVAVLDGPDERRALVAFGRALLPAAADKPVFSVPLEVSPSVAISAVHAPAVIPGQAAPVVARLRGIGVKGRTTAIALERRGVAVAKIAHEWKSDDETFAARFGFVPAGAGIHRLRVTASTAGVAEPVAADLGVVARDRRLRVLVYDPRPTWPLVFVRRSLEGDPLFDVSSTVRTSSRIATTSADAPATLAGLQAERFDAVLAGAPEGLTDREMRALELFVSRRGGALILLPDRRVPDPVRRRLGLPPLGEALLERPITTLPPAPLLRASELLLTPSRGRGFAALATVRHGDQTRAVVAEVLTGDGRIILSGALDAWRYRADSEVSFDMFWRSLIADAAAAAPPRLNVAIEPDLARPGDDVVVSVVLRATELSAGSGGVAVPAIAGRLVSSDGRAETIRLWPGVTPGSFTARMKAPRPGQYSVSVTAGGAAADAPLLVAEDVVHALPPTSRAAAFAAAVSGGEVLAGVPQLAARIRALDTAHAERRTHPMRSAWWILPFAGALCAEWALRRRSGLR